MNDNILKLKCMSFFDSLDVLFVGNSYTYSGIDTGVLDSSGIRTLNLGIATAGPSFYKVVVDSYLQQTSLHPRVICVLSSPTSFSSKSDNFSAYPVHRYISKPISNELIFAGFNRHDYVEMLRNSFKKGVANLIRVVFPRTAPHCGCQCYVEKHHRGFVPSNEINTTANINRTQHNYAGFVSESFDHAKAEAFIQFCRDMKGKGMFVVLYTIPTNTLESYFNEQFLNEYQSFMAEVSKEFQVVRTTLPVDNKYYRNIDHINSYGASIVTKQIVHSLKAINI